MPNLLEHHFVQLPIKVDSTKLATELDQLEAEWSTHSLPNMELIPLVEFNPHTVSPNEVFNDLPYLQKLLSNWDIAIGSSRVSKLRSQGQVPRHVDVEYYWKHRLRIHIVVQTNPEALFGCGEHIVHLPAGEVWVSDNWSEHWISNKGDSDRIHIVVDTLGSEKIWEWISQGWNSDMECSQILTEKLEIFKPKSQTDILFDQYNHLLIRNPSEVEEIISDYIEEHPNSSVITKCLQDFVCEWSEKFAQFKHSQRSQYTDILNTTLKKIPDSVLSNGIHLHELLQTQIGDSLLPKPVILRPTFIVELSISGTIDLFNNISNHLRHTFTLPEEHKLILDSSIWKHLSEHLFNSTKIKWRDGCPSDLQNPIRWLHHIDTRDTLPDLFKLHLLFSDAHFVFLLESPELLSCQTKEFTEFEKSLYAEALERIDAFASQIPPRNLTLLSVDRMTKDTSYQNSVYNHLSIVLDEKIPPPESTLEKTKSIECRGIDKNQPHYANTLESWQHLNDFSWFN